MADVAPATVYNYFDTKPNLLMALALRHVQVAMPERRAFLKSLPEDPFDGIRAFERLLAEQALRHLSKECWRVILSAAFVDPGGRASRTGARLNTLIKRHYVRMVRTYQERGRIAPSVDPAALSDLIVGITTIGFRPLRLGVRRDDRGSFGHGASPYPPDPGRVSYPSTRRRRNNGVNSNFWLPAIGSRCLGSEPAATRPHRVPSHQAGRRRHGRDHRERVAVQPADQALSLGGGAALRGGRAAEALVGPPLGMHQRCRPAPHGPDASARATRCRSSTPRCAST